MEVSGKGFIFKEVMVGWRGAKGGMVVDRRSTQFNKRAFQGQKKKKEPPECHSQPLSLIM